MPCGIQAGHSKFVCNCPFPKTTVGSPPPTTLTGYPPQTTPAVSAITPAPAIRVIIPTVAVPFQKKIIPVFRHSVLELMQWWIEGRRLGQSLMQQYVLALACTVIW